MLIQPRRSRQRYNRFYKPAIRGRCRRPSNPTTEDGSARRLLPLLIMPVRDSVPEADSSSRQSVGRPNAPDLDTTVAGRAPPRKLSPAPRKGRARSPPSCGLPPASARRASSTISDRQSSRPGRWELQSDRALEEGFKWGDLKPRGDGSAHLSKAAQARRLAERGLNEQASGHPDEADRLLEQAQDLDPNAVAEVLREHDAGRAPDARLQDRSGSSSTRARRPETVV